jgi:hypothetical protein
MAKGKTPASNTIDPETLKLRADAAWRLRDQWRSTLRDCYELAMASRNPYDLTQNPRSLRRQFDSTAAISTIRAANRLLTEFTPPDQRWISFVPGPLLEMQLKENDLAVVKKKLAPITRLLQVFFGSGQFINAIWEVYIDLMVAGMAAMLQLENPSDFGLAVIVQCVSQAEISIEENGRGEVGAVFRKRDKMKIRQIADVWKDAKLPDALKRQLDDKKKKDPECNLIECTYEAPEGSAKRWCYQVLWANGSTPEVLVTRMYSTNPWTIFRWSKLPGIPYGPGPVMMALADIRTLNAVVEMILKNAALSLAGVYLVRDDGVINPDNVMINDGALIPVASTGGPAGASIMPLQTGRDFTVPQLVLERLQDAVKKALFDSALPPPEGGVRSPTEIIERLKELSQDIGGNIGRVTTDLEAMVRRTVDIHMQKGLIPAIHIDQFTLKVEIDSPLARAQQINDVQTVLQWVQMVQQVGGPQAVMLAANMEKIFVWLADKLGVPDTLVRSEDDQQAMQAQIAQMAAQAQQAQAQPPAQAAAAPAQQAQ